MFILNMFFLDVIELWLAVFLKSTLSKWEEKVDSNSLKYLIKSRCSSIQEYDWGRMRSIRDSQNKKDWFKK